MVHTCIVTEIKGGRVYTIEGNTSSASGVVANGGGVAAKSYALSYNRIGGYLRPYYSASNAPTETVTVTTYLLKRGHTGAAVRALQALLIGNGYDCGEVDGEFGPATERALVQYQDYHKLEADGECGRLTWTALLGGN
jgi:peptidoglycan hydrolase-like protein with peptidoglycan-binding domain